jgi:PAS domain S-box-containing protein
MFASPRRSLRELVRFAPLAIVELNSEGKVELWNPAAEQMFGWTEDEVAGRAYPVIPPEARGEFDDDLLHILAGSTVQGKPVRRQHKDGRRFDARVWAAPIHNQQNEITGMTAILEEITGQQENERKLQVSQAHEQDVEAQLQRSEERMRLAFDAAGIGFWDCDLVTGETVWSAVAARQMGLPEDAPMSFPTFVNAVHPEDRQTIQDSIASAVRDQTEHNLEFRALWPDGSVHARLAKGRASYDATGQPVRMLGVVVDIDERKAADERVRLQTAALEAAANSILITDHQGTILWTNHAFLQLTGYAREEVLGGNPRLLKSGDHDSGFYANLWATIASGRTWAGELTNRRKDGSLYPEEMTITPVRGGCGGITHYVAIKHDITLRKRAQDELRRAEEKYRSIFEDAVIGIMQNTPDGRPVSANRAAARICGYDSAEQFLAEVSDMGRQLFVSPDTIEELAARLQKDRALHGVELEIHTKDGGRKWMLANLRAVTDAKGIVVLHEGTIEDITERKQAEGFLREKAAMQDQLSAIIATVPGVVYSFLMRPDGSSAFPFATSRLEDIFDIAPEALKQDAAPALARIHPDDLNQVQQAVADSFRRLTPWHAEFRVNHPKKGVVWAEADSLPERQPDGSVLWHGFVLDITARKQLEAQLRQAQKLEAIGTLSSGVAHDFNNIMGVVVGYSDLIAEKLVPSDPNLARIRRIKDAAQRANALTRQLLAFGRQQALAPEVLDLSAHVTQFGKMLPHLLGEEIQLILSLDQNLWSVRADPAQVDQILLNLAVNARDALPHGGKVEIGTRNVDVADSLAAAHPQARPGAFVMISVADTGVGMSPEVMQHIFEPFFTTKARGQGTGLGLATVYGIVEQSGGFISVASEVGGGTRIQVFLPRDGGLTQAATPQDYAMPPSAPSRTVLLAEDDPALREVVSILLQELGYRVMAASSGPEAIRMAEKHAGTIDLLLSDVVMPEMNGRELADRLHQKDPRLKVLFVSGYTEDVVFRQGRLASGTSFLQKPVTKKDLDQTLRGLFEA